MPLSVAGVASDLWHRVYKWRDRPPTPRQARRAALDAAVKASFDDSGGTPGTYGSPRVLEDLLEAGWAVSVNTVAASMARQGLLVQERDALKAERDALRAVLASIYDLAAQALRTRPSEEPPGPNSTQRSGYSPFQLPLSDTIPMSDSSTAHNTGSVKL